MTPVMLFPRLPVLPGSRLAEDVPQGFDHQLGCFLGEEVAGGKGLAADVDGVFLPDAERVVAAGDETLAAPQREDRAFELAPRGEGLVVVDQVDGRRRAVVGAGARDRPRVAEAADVVLHHGGVEARARAEERADDGADPEAGVRADQLLGYAVTDRKNQW